MPSIIFYKDHHLLIITWTITNQQAVTGQAWKSRWTQFLHVNRICKATACPHRCMVKPLNVACLPRTRLRRNFRMARWFSMAHPACTRSRTACLYHQMANSIILACPTRTRLRRLFP
jgi:hypothetical protein